MSYMRAGHPYTHIDGENDSNDYVFGAIDRIEDYGQMATDTALDILFSQLDREKNIEEKDILIHCLKRICENLKIKVRDKPLTFEEFEELYHQIISRSRLQEVVRDKIKKGEKNGK